MTTRGIHSYGYVGEECQGYGEPGEFSTIRLLGCSSRTLVGSDGSINVVCLLVCKKPTNRRLFCNVGDGARTTMKQRRGGKFLERALSALGVNLFLLEGRWGGRSAFNFCIFIFPRT